MSITKLWCAIQKRMTIRPKLFIAFMGVVAIPLSFMVALGTYYLRRESEVREQETQASIQAGFRAMETQGEETVERMRRALQKAVVELEPNDDELEVVAPPNATRHMDPGLDMERLEQAGYPKRLAERIDKLRHDHPAIGGIKATVELDDQAADTVLDDLHPGFDWNPSAIPDSQTASDRPMLVQQERLGRTLLIAHHKAAVSPVTWSDDSKRAWTTKPGAFALWIVVEVDWAKIITPTTVKGGWAVRFDTKNQRLAHVADVTAMLAKEGLPPLPPLLKSFPADGGFQRVVHDNHVWLIYPETQNAVAKDATIEHPVMRSFAIVSEEALKRPLWIRRIALLFAFGFSLGFALMQAYQLSGKFVGKLTALESGAAAIAQGDFAAFEQRAATDEFGRLAESMNRMAEQLAQRMRKEEIDGWRRLVRVLSHEINNTLGPVRSVAATVRDQIATRLTDGDAAEDLQLAFRLIIDRTDALSSFIANYAELAKLPDPVKAPTAIGDVVRSGVELLSEFATQHKVKIIDYLDPSLPLLPLDRAQLERVVINLVKNAIEAAPADTIVTVRTERSVQGIDLVVEDRGSGISADARRHLFVPYFTTKPGGSGLGLALVRQIVLGHGGSVVAEDRVEGGTRMRVTLPPT